jgi:Lrp/AsnC family leucine-responsive transcriptional regulator
MAGEYDYMLTVLMNDTKELEDFLSNKMKSIKGVRKPNTLIVLSTLKETANR